MIYRVFLDTNIYDGANYSFQNAQFKRLEALAANGQLILVINSVIEGEVRDHINDRIKKAVKELDKATRDYVFAGFRKAAGFEEKLSIGNSSEWIGYAQNEFARILTACSARRVTLNGIDVEAVVSDYFHQRLPFEAKKPDEFKDAIAIKSLLLDMKQAWNEDPDLIQYCIVSADKGFTEAVRTAIGGTGIEDYTLFFDSLLAFTDYLNEMDKQMQFMLRYLQSEYGEDLLHDIVEDALELATYDVESDEDIVEQEVTDVNILSVTPHVVSLTNTAGTPDNLETEVEGEAEISIDYTYNDDENSFYDSETKSYLFVVSKRVSATYRIDFSIPMSFVVDECLAEDEELESQDDTVFENKSMMLDAYEEQSINLREKNMISYEIAETSDGGAYDICPDCGCRIGLENDGGNGFCIKCAPNH